MPVVLLKNVGKTLKEGFQTARQRLSIGSAAGDSFSDSVEKGAKGMMSFGSTSFSSLGRSEKGKKSRSFDESSMIAQMHTSFPTLGFARPIVESSKEFELEFEDEEPSEELKAVSTSSPRDKEAQSNGRFHAMFRKPSFPSREDKGRKSRSFDESSMIAQMHSSFPTLGFARPIAESSKEFELEFENEEPSEELEAVSTSSPRDPEAQSKGRFPALFRKKKSDMSDLTLDEAPSRISSFLDAQRSFLDSPQKSSFRRGKKGSDVSNDSSDDAKNDAPHVFRPGMKRSEMSTDATTEDSSPPVNPDGDARHSRIPGVLRMSLSALKRNHGSG
jgi:hypothetical protein